MDWIDTIERFDTFGRYPFSTVIHWLVGIWCGFRLEYGNRIASAVVLFAAWVAYETTEYLTEHDNPDVDIANGIGGLLLGIILAHAWQFWRSRV